MALGHPYSLLECWSLEAAAALPGARCDHDAAALSFGAMASSASALFQPLLALITASDPIQPLK